MSLVLRKPAFCICENKDADQLRGNHEADQCLCFRYTDSTIPLLSKSKISSLLPYSVTVQPGLCQTWSETPKTGFLRTRLILCLLIYSKRRRQKSKLVCLCFKFIVISQTTALKDYQSIYEPRCEKTGLRDFRPGPTQTGLYSHRR